MSQFEFVSRLRRCLAGLPEEEIDRAVEYYEDYFADAGESEEEVIKKLGSPEELAKNIRRELLERQEKTNDIYGEEAQGVFTERGFETKQDRENYQQVDKFTQLEKKENPFEKKEESKNNTGDNIRNDQYHYDDKKERKKNRRFIATLLMIFGFIWICIVIFIAAIYLLFFAKRGSEREATTMEYAEKFMEDLEDVDPVEEIGDVIESFTEDDEEDSDNVSGNADILPDQDIQELKVEIGAGRVVIQEEEKFSLRIKKNGRNAKISSKVKDGVWKIEEDTDIKSNFSLKDLKNIVKGMKKGVSIVITVPVGFQADKIDIEVGAGKVTADTLLAEEADFEVSAGTIVINNLTVTEKMDMEVGMGTVEISEGYIHDLNLECDMGKASFRGRLTGKNEINCNMGTVELGFENDASDYNFSAKSDMGSVTIDGESYGGFSSKREQGEGDTEVKIEVNMGSVKVETGIDS